MSLLRALRAYVGLGPDEDYEAGDLMPPVSGHGKEGRSMARNDDYWSYGAAPPSKRDQKRVLSGIDDGDDHGEPRAIVDDRERGRNHNERQRSSAPVVADPEPVIDLRSADVDDDEDWVDNEDEHWSDADQSDRAVVRSLDAVRARPKTVSPGSFAEARELADEFRDGIPVVLNLHGIDRDLARRLIDFASGVCYCMDGTMEKIGSSVFLLTPEGVEVAEEDRVRILQRGYAR